MSKHYEKHAEEVANAFLGLLDEGVDAQISDEHKNELSMLIEAAISTAVLSELERASDEVMALSKRLRQHAEHYDEG